MAIGDPARKDKEAKVVLDGITDTATGELVTPVEMAARLSGTRIIFLGESHTSIDFHRVQLRVIELLQKAGKRVQIGLEMYPYTEQASLDLWNAGSGSEDDFVAKSRWYKNWGYHWHYYRDIFLFARQNGLKMYGVNTPREVVSAVRKKGLQNLTAEEASRIPPKIDTDNEDHKTLFRAFFAGEESMMHTMSAQMFDGMFAAQCTWDASMGYNAVQNLKKFGGPKAIMVVLIGSGHVAYNLGVQRQAALWFDGRMASIVPVSVADLKGRPTSPDRPEAEKLLAAVRDRLAAHEWYVADFYMKRRRWAGAAGRLEGILKDFPGSRREPEAMLLLAQSYLAMAEDFRAQQAAQRLVARYPDDPRRAEAEALLARLRK